MNHLTIILVSLSTLALFFVPLIIISKDNKANRRHQKEP